MHDVLGQETQSDARGNTSITLSSSQQRTHLTRFTCRRRFRDVALDFVENGGELLRMQYGDVPYRLTGSAAQFIFRRV